MIDCYCDSLRLQRIGHDFDCIYMMCKKGSTIVDMPLDRLIYDDNYSTSQEWYQHIKESIEKYGQTFPIKVKKLCGFYEVTDGKVRAQIAFEAGLKVIKAEIVL